MQRCNQNSGNSNSNTTSNSNNSSSSSSNKRCPQKYNGNNLAPGGGMVGYQQHATATLQHGGKHSARKSRYNSNKQQQQQQHQQHQQHQQQQQQQHQQSAGFGNIQKRNGIAGMGGSEISPSPPTSTWLERGYGHRLANSSCMEGIMVPGKR